MNKKMHSDITTFINKVGDYIYMEYDTKYYKMFTRDRNLCRIFDFVTSHYCGGANVPDTAGYVVEFIDKHLKDKK
jgi:hypothetical protein